MNRRIKILILMSALSLSLGLLGCAGDEDQSPMMVASQTSVKETYPEDGAASVPVTTSISVTFSDSMQQHSVTGKSSGNACGGAVQLSSNDFNTCVPFSSSVAVTENAKRFTLVPIEVLEKGLTYKIKVSLHAKSKDNYSLPSEWVTPRGFITESGAKNATSKPSVVGISPANNTTGVSPYAAIQLTFDQALDSSSLTYNSVADGGVCSGSVQVSADNFSKCLPHNGPPTSSNYKTWTLNLKSYLPYYSTIKVRVTTGVKASGVAMGAQYTSAGFGVSGWSFYDGGSANGLNYSSVQDATEPQVVIRNGVPVVAWSEGPAPTQLRVKVSNSSTSWYWADSVSLGINYNTAQSAIEPSMILYNNNVIVAWSESNGSIYQLRVSKWDGATWARIDGGGANGINFNTGENASTPFLVVHNSNLYVVWSEYNTSNVAYQIRLAQWDGANTWTFKDGASTVGLNNNTSLSAQTPVAASKDGVLYLAWSERNSSAKWQIRLAEWNGTSGVTFRDSGAANGVNLDVAQNAYTPAIIGSGKITLVWRETGVTTDLVQLGEYNSQTLTFSNLTGSSGLNANTNHFAQLPLLLSRGNELFVSWTEDNSSNIAQVRFISIGSGGTWIDQGGLNYNSTNPTIQVNATTDGTSIYLTWIELSGGFQQVRVAKLP